MSEMKPLNVSLPAWIIQDGNYEDFCVGQDAKFALEFYTETLKPSKLSRQSAVHLMDSKYQICGQIVFREEDVCVLDMGFLAYQENAPPEFTKGTWVEGEIQLGVDPFMYFETLKDLAGRPLLTYSFCIREIQLETTPWLTTPDSSGRTMMIRNEEQESYKQVSKTDADDDDDGNAHYILTCVSTDGRI